MTSNDSISNSPERLTLRERLRFLARDSFVYGAASAVSAGFGLITFPVLARHFSVEEYGVVDFFSVAAAFLTILLIFGQDTAVARFFYEHADKSVRQQVISQSLAFQLILLALILPLLWFTRDGLVGILPFGEEAEVLVSLILLQVPCQVLLNFSQNLLKWTFSRTGFLVLSLGSAAGRVLLIVVAVYWFDIGVAGVFVVILIVQAAFAMVGVGLIRQWLVRPADLSHWRPLLAFGAPYGVICAIGAFAPAMERSAVAIMLSAEDLGWYAAGAKLAMLISLPAHAFQTAWGPFSLAIYKESDAIVTYNWVLKCFTMVMCILVLVVTFASPFLLVLLASARYSGAWLVVFPLSMAMAVQSISWIPEIGISLSKRSYLNLYAYVAFLMGAAGGIYLGGRFLGLLGAALGVLLAYILKSGIAVYLSKKAYDLPWATARSAVAIFVTIVVGVGAVAVGAGGYPVVRNGLLLAGVVLLPLFSWLLLFTADERGAVRRILKLKWMALLNDPAVREEFSRAADES